MSLGHKIAKSKENWERKVADFYPTPIDATIALMGWWKLPRGLRVLEPCCGEGHISRILERRGLEVTSRDLLFTGYGQGGINYLTSPEASRTTYEFDAVITNPPFSLAEQFIRRALRDAPLVAMFLPNDYWHAKGRLRLFQSRPPKAVLALTWRPVFLPAERGKSPLANYSWTVWDDDYDGQTQYTLLPKPSFHNLPPLPPTDGVRIARTGMLPGLMDALQSRVQ